MIRIFITTMLVALAAAVVQAEAADGRLIDRIEDRIDRRESIRDERVDHGPRDVIEDRLDRRESRRDSAGYDRPTPVDRWERRKLRRWWHSR